MSATSKTSRRKWRAWLAEARAGRLRREKPARGKKSIGAEMRRISDDGAPAR